MEKVWEGKLHSPGRSDRVAGKNESEKIVILNEKSVDKAKKDFFGKAVVRVGFLLIIVLVTFTFVRESFIPGSFGQYGRYRGDSIQENVAFAAMYAEGTDTCRKCHQDVFNKLSVSRHTGIDCQTCHGAGEKHSIKPEAFSLKIDDSKSLCESCHISIAGRRDKQIATVNVMHSGGVNCTTCHNPHSGMGGRNS